MNGKMVWLLRELGEPAMGCLREEAGDQGGYWGLYKFVVVSGV